MRFLLEEFARSKNAGRLGLRIRHNLGPTEKNTSAKRSSIGLSIALFGSSSKALSAIDPMRRLAAIGCDTLGGYAGVRATFLHSLR